MNDVVVVVVVLAMELVEAKDGHDWEWKKE